MPNWLGDCVMAMPALRHLSEWLPNAKIYLAGRTQFRDLFAAQPGIAGFAEAPSSGLGKLIKGMAGARRFAREAGLPERFDLGLLFTNSLSTAAWMWRLGPKIRIGYDTDCRRLFLTNPAPCGGVEKSWHFVRYYMWLIKFAESLLGETGDVAGKHLESLEEYMTPQLSVGEEAREKARALLADRGIIGRYAVIAPASAYGAVKDWPPEHYRRLVEMLNGELSLPVVVTGAAGQAAVCQSIAEGRKRAINLAGQTSMREFAGLLAEADLFVGGDSGGAHVAGALGIPTVVIFGITNPTRTRPAGRLVTSLGEGEEHDVKLSTPEAREAAAKALAAIAPEAVLAAARETLCNR